MLSEEEIERCIQTQKHAVKLTGSNLISFLIYKIALERAYKRLHLAERNILLHKYCKNRRASI